MNAGKYQTLDGAARHKNYWIEIEKIQKQQNYSLEEISCSGLRMLCAATFPDFCLRSVI